ncbi:hypothetical protein BCR36DRAFT_307149, partial [Piromyces finnis]
NFYGVSYSNLKSLIKKDYRFPFFHIFDVYIGKYQNGYNDRKKYINIIVTYDIMGVVQCVSKDYTYSSSKTERKEYKKNGHNPYLPPNCSFGRNPPVELWNEFFHLLKHLT